MSKKLTLAKPAASTLALPPTAPPPRKEDIINAMVERARVKHAEESAKLNEKREAAKKALYDAIAAELEKNPQSFQREINSYSHRVSIEYVCRVVPPNITRLQAAYNAVPHIGLFDLAAVRRKIREQYSNVSAGERVKALLSNPEAVKALDEALAKIG
jgi:pyruvate/2-oxoglutarate dehydrogenase complex dihydrolipoamide acyltransferase (E2) component